MEAVGKLLPTIFKRQMRREDSRLVEILGPCWQQAAGKGISDNSKPISFVAGTLTLETTCPSWAAQLRCMTEEIRSRINSFLRCSAVKDIQVQLARNLGQREPVILRDKFPLASAREPGAGRGTMGPGVRKPRTVGGIKSRIAARGAGRID